MYQPSQNLLTPRSSEQSISIPIIPNCLYWISSKDIPNKEADSIFIFADQSHKYQAFNYDFGPHHLGEVYRFVTKLQSALRICKKSNTKICVFTGNDPQKQANSIFLLCSYLVISLGLDPEKAVHFFKDLLHIIPPYRDCTADPFSHYKCYIVECLNGLKFAFEKKWFDFNTFNAQEYDYISQKGNGDYNDIVPGKMIAFSGPLSQRPPGSYGQVYTPQDYVPLFKKLGVTLVVRLNEKKYDEQIFINNGIDHIDLIFDDGSTPPQHIVEKFLSASESTPGKVAVHCKSGFGRTGTLIGMYAMKHFKIPAKDFIGWMRIARPGSIHGPQHEYLVDHQEEMFAQNAQFNSPIKTHKKNYGRTNETATPIKGDFNSNSGNKNQISGLNKISAQFSNVKISEFTSKNASLASSPQKSVASKQDQIQQYRKILFSKEQESQQQQLQQNYMLQPQQQEQQVQKEKKYTLRHQRYNSSIESSNIYRRQISLTQNEPSEQKVQQASQKTENNLDNAHEKYLQKRRESYQQKAKNLNLQKDDSTCSSTTGNSISSLNEQQSNNIKNLSTISNYDKYQKQSLIPHDNVKNNFSYNYKYQNSLDSNNNAPTFKYQSSYLLQKQKSLQQQQSGQSGQGIVRQYRRQMSMGGCSRYEQQQYGQSDLCGSPDKNRQATQV